MSLAKQKVVLNVKSYDWYINLSDIPQDPENIKVFYRDRVEEENTDTDTRLLSVHKPEFQKCPEPDSILLEWLIEGWSSFRNDVHVRVSLERHVENNLSNSNIQKTTSDSNTFSFEHLEENPKEKEDNVIIEYFKDDDVRVKAYEKWMAIRGKWVEKQKIIDKTRSFFTELYQIHVDLERDSETIELVVANGFLRDKTNWDINHPIITRRIKIQFSPNTNTISVEDTEVVTELYTMLFHAIDGINLDAITILRDDLYKNDYHPMDRNDTPVFLKTLIHHLSPESVFSENGEPSEWYNGNRLLMYFNPALIVRRRVDGTLKAVEKIIENIEETGQIPPHLKDIVSGGQIDIIDDPHEETIEELLAAVGGESIDILLSKEANKEQLEIAKRIQHYNAVLVQGPPGTGKTHTIANLMGHFLAHNKSVLVTSHTKKALSVLKEQVEPGLQNLCVSVLDDSNVDMEKSIDGITDVMAKYTSNDLKREMESANIVRNQIIRHLGETRKKLFSIINREQNSIVLNGEEISPSKAAAFVLEHEMDLSYIPGNVRLYSPLPVDYSELMDVYRSNEGITAQEESELACELPNPTKLLSPTEYMKAWQALDNANQRITSIAKENEWSIKYDKLGHAIAFTTKLDTFQVKETTDENLRLLGSYIASFGKVDTWMKHAAVDGKKGGQFKQRWITLIEQIRKTCDYSESIVSEQFGNKIVFSPDARFQELASILENLRKHFVKKGKVTKFDLLFNNTFEKGLSAVTINGIEVQSAHDCEIALHIIELSNERDKCAVYWHDLLTVHGVPEFFALDASEPEHIAEKWIEPINLYLNWYEQGYKQLINYLEIANIPLDFVIPQNKLDSDWSALNRILMAITDRIPVVIDSCQNILIIKGLRDLLRSTESELQQDRRTGSSICRDMLQALHSGNFTAYATSYTALQVLFSKYDLQKKRDTILEKIEPIAPQWADAIRNRTGVHGENTVPSTIEDAWRWKQYQGIVAEIMKEPFNELQAKSFLLSQKYRKITAKFAEKSAWYHLLNRTERDIDMKQALQGWKLTVRKIGKGTGKNAPLYKAKARELMAKCQTAVPAWIMPMSKALESLDPKTNRFDVIIVDEASQSDVCSLAIAYMAKKLIIVGDDKQVSPMAVGTEINKINALIKLYLDEAIPNAHLYTPTTSLYDIAGMTFQPLMLKEHFRCVPEIIGFSNGLSYDFRIKPLRDASNSLLRPAVVNYRVANGERQNNRKDNPNEARSIVALLMACMEQPEYNGKTFGVISMLGDEQAKLIQALILEHIDAKDIECRRILCGNASNFQGDERDVVFLSICDSNSEIAPLRMLGFGPDDAYRKRYNVAASRARDQLWVVHSLDSTNDLKQGDLRKRVIDYSLNPSASEYINKEIEEKAESVFEAEVAKSLVGRGYHLVQQWHVGSYRLDMVAVCGEKRVAIECDGEQWHSGEAKIREDMERQTILERTGWRFIRIRGSEYFRNPDVTIKRVICELREFGIEPEDQHQEQEAKKATELLQRIKLRAATILGEFDTTYSNSVDFNSIAYALNAKKMENKDVPSIKHDYMNNKNEIESPAALSGHISDKLTKESDQMSLFEDVNQKGVEKESNISQSELASTDIVSEANDVIKLIKAAEIEYVDMRKKGGALWIIGGRDELAQLVQECSEIGCNFTFKKGGGRATKHRDGWWAN